MSVTRNIIDLCTFQLQVPLGCTPMQPKGAALTPAGPSVIAEITQRNHAPAV
jgi:hypothetical protein